MQLTEKILKICGLGRYLLIHLNNSKLLSELLKRSIDASLVVLNENEFKAFDGIAPNRIFCSTLENLALNFEAKFFDNIIIGIDIQKYSSDALSHIFKILHDITKNQLIILLPFPSSQKNIHFSVKEQLEKFALQNNFRKHPRNLLALPYNEIENTSCPDVLFFEKIPTDAESLFNMEWLLKNRDLHMDMLREVGRRSDAHTARYAYAAKLIRQTDTVVDIACGLGYGTSILAACSSGEKFIGLDLDEDSIEYARLNYARHNDGVTFNTCNATNLNFIADHSIDIVVSFETIEHLEDYESFLREISRILKPDGRLIGSVPNLWCDETGQDPNPYHFHVFDWDKLSKVIEQYFVIDERVAQLAGGGYKFPHSKRIMQSIPINFTQEIDAEWWVFSACAKPIIHSKIPYQNPFQKNNTTLSVHIDFAKYYDDPWIYRTLIQLGERITDPQVLVEQCMVTLPTVRVGTADQGGILCVLAYQLLSTDPIHFANVVSLVELINNYDEHYDRNNPHCIRWAISLHYVAARILLAIGQRQEALMTFASCIEIDPLKFCPLIATKTISAYFYSALICVGDQNNNSAKQHLVDAIHLSHRVLQGDWQDIIKDFSDPLLFGLPEISEILDLASQCAEALHALAKNAYVPGYFWEKVQLKRFGLVEWNKNLEKENEQLRKNAC